MFDCVMCKNPEQSCYRASLCSKCEETKKIVAIYGIDRVNEALLEIFFLTRFLLISNRMNKKFCLLWITNRLFLIIHYIL